MRAESLAESHPPVRRKTGLASNELGYLAKEISKQCKKFLLVSSGSFLLLIVKSRGNR